MLMRDTSFQSNGFVRELFISFFRVTVTCEIAAMRNDDSGHSKIQHGRIILIRNKYCGMVKVHRANGTIAPPLRIVA